MIHCVNRLLIHLVSLLHKNLLSEDYINEFIKINLSLKIPLGYQHIFSYFLKDYNYFEALPHESIILPLKFLLNIDFYSIEDEFHFANFDFNIPNKENFDNPQTIQKHIKKLFQIKNTPDEPKKTNLSSASTNLLSLLDPPKKNKEIDQEDRAMIYNHLFTCYAFLLKFVSFELGKRDICMVIKGIGFLDEEFCLNEEFKKKIYERIQVLVKQEIMKEFDKLSVIEENIIGLVKQLTEEKHFKEEIVQDDDLNVLFKDRNMFIERNNEFIYQVIKSQDMDKDFKQEFIQKLIDTGILNNTNLFWVLNNCFEDIKSETQDELLQIFISSPFFSSHKNKQHFELLQKSKQFIKKNDSKDTYIKLITNPFNLSNYSKLSSILFNHKFQYLSHLINHKNEDSALMNFWECKGNEDNSLSISIDIFQQEIDAKIIKNILINHLVNNEFFKNNQENILFDYFSNFQNYFKENIFVFAINKFSNFLNHQKYFNLVENPEFIKEEDQANFKLMTSSKQKLICVQNSKIIKQYWLIVRLINCFDEEHIENIFVKFESKMNFIKHKCNQKIVKTELNDEDLENIKTLHEFCFDNNIHKFFEKIFEIKI